MVLCCICGVEIIGRHAGARCPHCLAKEVDITDGICRRIHIQKCSHCERYQRPPWVFCEPESRDLLTLCLKHLKGLTKEHRVVDARFIWTEPHSKELKVKLTIQKEALASVVVEQSMVIEYRVDDQQCDDCRKSYTKHTWESSVQVRQRAEHRRTLAQLEQLILHHKAHSDVIGLEAKKDGADFFFRRHRDAEAFVAFVKSWAILKHESSKHLVSHNERDGNSFRFKRTISVELCPVSRDDLVILPPRTAQALGGLPPLMLCTRANSSLTLVDPASLRAVEIASADYWKRPFTAVCVPDHLTEFTVLDITIDEGTEGRRAASGSSAIAASRGRLRACDVELARMADLGHNDERIITRSHLGFRLHVGDEVLGYDLRTMNVAALEDSLLASAVPLDVYLVKKKKRRTFPVKAVAGPRTRRGASTAEGLASASGPPSGGDRQCEEKDDSEDEDTREEAAAQAAAADQFLGAMSLPDADGGEEGAGPEAAPVLRAAVEEVAEVERLSATGAPSIEGLARPESSADPEAWGAKGQGAGGKGQGQRRRKPRGKARKGQDDDFSDQ